MLCFVHRISFIHTAVTNLDSKSIQASVPVGPDAKRSKHALSVDSERHVENVNREFPFFFIYFTGFHGDIILMLSSTLTR